MLHCLPFNDLQNKWLWFFCPSLSVVLQLLSDRTDMQSVWTFTRNLNLIGATQTLPSSLNVLLFSNAFGLRSVRSSISSRHHAQVVLWIYVLGTCIHHCNIPAVFIFFFLLFFFAYDLHGDYFVNFSNMERGFGCIFLIFLVIVVVTGNKQDERENDGLHGKSWSVKQVVQVKEIAPSYVLFYSGVVLLKITRK